MTARATVPVMAESAITTLFESAITATRIFWVQRPDGSLVCVDWDWCCPEIPAVLGGLEVVIFVTAGRSRAEVVDDGVLLVSLRGARLWGRWERVLARPPRGVRAVTWDDRLEVDL